MTAIVVAENELVGHRAAVDAVREKFFGSSEMKSSKIRKSKPKRRLKLLSALADAGCHSFTVVIDKTKLDPQSGFRFRSSFYKYFNGFLFGTLNRAYPELALRVDHIGRKTFEESYRRYLEKKPQLSFFSRPDITYVNSGDEPLVQAADIVAGSIRIAYGLTTKAKRRSELLQAIKPLSHRIHDWPASSFALYGTAPLLLSAGADEHIARAADRSARVFLQEAADSDDEVLQAHALVVRTLLEAHYGEGSEYQTQDQLGEQLSAHGHRVSKDYIRRNVIPALRDSGVLVVSGERGFALPRNGAAVERYFLRMQSEVQPIMRRVNRQNDWLYAISKEKTNILRDSPRLSYLRLLSEIPTD